ncbi:hypothetical protein GCM10007049_21390 [Echinicola pacifica]|uniref:Uncharacterized protein n=1 Tax=Echinicola pacifica TaxID=346377 RepID=A0A918PZI5_9BACT|nr:hypothetical protein [Echinicola pacifica]GGZ28182.1 hypothetical protein GCM10007049_21390 [Echinicola pacifica]
MKSILKKFIASSFLFILSISLASAQCAMCRASVENNVANGDTTVGASLNMGILYLFVAPYLLAAIIGFLWYRNSRKSKVSV